MSVKYLKVLKQTNAFTTQLNRIRARASMAERQHEMSVANIYMIR